ncbi:MULTISPECIES: hypothetical protein [Streptomyces]|uniref:hypothetical protein n=1 Tax=Streptomyces TaxID=1883 RepID=UPI002FC67A65
MGFDCSSLVQYAYRPQTQLPRTAAAQYEATAHRPVSRGWLCSRVVVLAQLLWCGNSEYVLPRERSLRPDNASPLRKEIEQAWRGLDVVPAKVQFLK